MRNWGLPFGNKQISPARLRGPLATHSPPFPPCLGTPPSELAPRQNWEEPQTYFSDSSFCR